MRLATLIFLLLWGISTFLIVAHWQKEEQERLDENSAALATTYRATITTYRLATEILFADVIQRPEVIDTFARGVQAVGAEQNRLRGKLYRLLAVAYDHLTGHGIQQLQFHTADGTSFLRFHAPDKYGDPLLAVRPSVRIANRERRPTVGFEIGRLSSSFRFVYPIESGDKLLGVVEVGIPFRAINEALSRIDSSRTYQLVLRKAALQETVLPEQLPLYVASSIAADFLVEDAGLHLPTSPLPLPAEIETLNRQLHDDRRLREGLASGKSFALVVGGADDDWVVTCEPIDDLRGLNVAYLISYGKAPFLADMRRELFIALLATALGMATLYWLGIRLLTAHATLRREKQHLQTLTDTIADGVCVMDQRGRILQVNPAFTEILGYPAAEVVGEIGHHLFHVHGDGSDIPVGDCPIISATSLGTDYSGEEVFRHRDGRLLTVELSCKPFRQKTHVEGSVTAFRDISQRKATELRLKENDRIKNEFIATASHELRTPLAVIQGYAELLLEGEGFSGEQQRDFASIVHQKALALERIVDDLLDVSRIETGRPLCLECEQVDMVAELRQVVAVFAREAVQRRFVTTLPGEEVWLAVDRFKIVQVLENLLNNAVKFSRPGSVIEVMAQVQAGMLRVAVTDQGQGVSAEQLPHIFDKFFRVDNSNTAQPGFGLGLYLVKRIVEAHKGQVWVESVPGQGSTFGFTLPLRPTET
jgi:PAS domain S-box-containing protein